MPSKPSDTNTHYTTRIYAGASGTASNSSASDPYVKITDDNVYRNQIQIKGGGATTISSDANGVITISSTDTNTHPDLSSYAKKTDIPSIPSLSGGSAASNDATVVGGVTVNGHAVSVGKKTITGAGTVSVTGSTTGITITGTAHPTSLKNPHSLTFGSKSYDGSSTQEITAADLGLGAALKYKGITTTNVVDDRTTANVTIDSKPHTPSTGDVVFYGNKEFV
jgi:hypothetical protein